MEAASVRLDAEHLACNPSLGAASGCGGIGAARFYHLGPLLDWDCINGAQPSSSPAQPGFRHGGKVRMYLLQRTRLERLRAEMGLREIL